MADKVEEIAPTSANIIHLNPATTLPQELIDSIIDEVAENDTDSFDDIKACSLTARRFRRRTLCHLFRCLSFQAPAQWSQFLEFISESPHIPPYYTTLQLVSYNSFEAIPASILERVLASLINIQVLWMSRAWENVLVQPSFHTCIASMPLKEVHLDSTTFSLLKDFAVFFKEALLGARVVELDDLSLVVPSEARALDRSEFVSENAPAVLRELVLFFVERAFLDAIAMGCIGSLKALERFEYCGPNSPTLTTFLTCSALKTLVLQVFVDDDSESLSTAGHFPCLECLTIYFGTRGRGLLLTWLIHCISSRRIGSCLKRLSFEGYLSRTLHLLALTKFDQVMSENLAQYPDLQGLTIPPGIREISAECVPKLMALGFIL